MDAELNQEINQRLASARQAFEELKRPIFKNTSIDVKGRQQLYQSLIASRLLCGSAVWSDISAAQVQQIEVVLTDHHRRIHDEGFWKSSRMTDEEFLARSQMMPFRILWARSRLVYLQSLGKHGREFHVDLLLQEFCWQRGWLWEVRTDLQWMKQLVEISIHVPDTCDDWTQSLAVISQCKRWKSLIGRACRKHLLQEKIATEINTQHHAILHHFREQGCEIVIPKESEETVHTNTFGCGQCDKKFATYHGLATHMYQKHGTMSMERPYIQSTVCAGCLKDFHTTWRVQQHLRYRPNGCWDRIDGARSPDTPETILLAPHLKGIKRLPAVRRMYGPIRPN